MKPVKLGNEKALQITNALHIQELTNRISQYGIDIEYKRYHFLDKNRANELKQKEHSFVLNTYGAKYLLFLTYVNFKPYALYINRKNSTFFLVKTRFDVSLYQDTMFEGETIKINEKWYFYVGDCLVYKKANIVVQSYTKRYEILGNIEPFELIRKDKYEYDDIMGVKNSLIGTLPFRVNGYVFKCLETASYDILYIFPECRNKQPEDGNSPPHAVVDDSKTPQSSQQAVPVQLKSKDEATFLMKKTEFPDVYEIYMFDSSNSKKAKVGYAGIPNIECSVMVKNWFLEKDEIYAKCKKNPVNEKWIPVQLL